MGQRCDLVIREGGRIDARYSHHAANRLDNELFWGPEQARRFIRAQRAADGEMLDEIWSEGGALLDLDARRLLWYGGEDVAYDVHLRRDVLRAMAVPWAGYELVWAREGIADLADAAGVPRARVLVEPRPLPPDFSPARYLGRGREVLTVVGDDGVPRWIRYPGGPRGGLYRVAALLVEALVRHLGRPRSSAAGEALIVAAGGGELDTTPATFVDATGGLHVDLCARRVEGWCAAPAPDGPARLRDGCPGWEAVCHHDDPDAQTRATGGLVRFASSEDAAAWMRRAFLRERPPGDTLSLPLDARREVLEHALEAAGLGG